MKFRYIILGLCILAGTGCTDQEIVENHSSNTKCVKVSACIFNRSRVYFEESDSLTFPYFEIGDSITLNTTLQGSRNYVADHKQEDGWTIFNLIQGEWLKNTEGEIVYSTYPATHIQDGTAILPATNVWRNENKASFMYGMGEISNAEVKIEFNHPFSYLKFTLAMVPEALSSVTTSDGDKTIHRVLVESASGSLGVVKGNFDFENQSMDITESSKSVEVILEKGYQLEDSLVERAIYIPILPQEANVEMNIYALHDTETGCDTLFSSKKQAPSTGFLAGNVYKLGIRGNNTSTIVGDSLSIYLANAGQLSQYVTDAQKTSIKKLRVAGYLNGDDIRLIREMAGVDWGVNETNGQLTSLDISEATIVEGGGAYFADGDLVRYTEKYIIGEYMFQYTKLTDIKMPKNTTKIEKLAFRETPLVSITIPEHVTSVGIEVYSGCVSLSSISIPNSVTSIGSWAFNHCTSLTDITIPNSVTFIGDEAFKGCRSLANITLSESLDSIAMYTFYGCNALDNVTIPNSVTSIGDFAFRECTSLKSVQLPNNLSNMGIGAFYQCSSLSTIDIPNTVTKLESTFTGCTLLDNVVIPEGVVSIEAAFQECSSLSNITIPNSVANMNNTFTRCVSLTDITIPESVTSLLGTFSECSALVNVNISDSVKIISDYAFGNCTSLDGVSLPTNLTEIGEGAFWECTSLSNVNIPEGVTLIAKYAFKDCTALHTITVPDLVSSIEDYTFEGCTVLNNITLGKSVASIGVNAFNNAPITVCNIYAETPPTIDATSFTMDKTTATVNVPTGFATAYQNSDWATYWGNIVEM